VLLASLSPARAWQVSFGGCTFSDGPGGALARSGSCPGQSGRLRLNSKAITSVPAGTFANMSALLIQAIKELKDRVARLEAQ